MAIEPMMACPFCGADGEDLVMLEIDAAQYAVMCDGCTGIGPSDARRDWAVMRWNGSALRALGRTRGAFERAVTVAHGEGAR